MAKTHIASDETLKSGLHDISVSLQLLANNKRPVYDSEAGEYTDASIAAMIQSGCDGLFYGVEFSTGKSVEGTKLGENAKYDNPVPYTLAKAGSDPYKGVGPFRYWIVNGYYDATGMPHVTAILGDGRFAYDGSNGDVWCLYPILYMREILTDSTIQRWVCDSPADGYTVECDAVTDRGESRPFILRAKYPLVNGPDGKVGSVSGAPMLRFVSHNGVISLTRKKGPQYSGKTRHDDTYLKWMLDLKYATKHSQSVYTGCTGHTEQPAVTVAGDNVSTVTVKASTVAAWPVGSYVMVGSTKVAGRDRGNNDTHDLADSARIVSKTVDGDNCVLALDCDPITTEVGMIVSTCPWATGSCDALEGDGSPTDPKSGREPFAVQGMEIGHGSYEVLEDVILKSEGNGWKVYVSRSTRNDVADALPSDAICVGDYPGPAAEGWNYPLYDKMVHGFMLLVGTGASQSTGTCDGNYKNADTVVGLREFLTVGNLGSWGYAGLRCVVGDGGLGYGGWDCGSRLSGNGPSGGEAA